MKNRLEMDVIEQITMLLQVVLVIFVVTFGIASVFEGAFFKICEILIGLLMFVIGYNNQKIYKRKYMTAVYIGLGVVIIATTFFA